MRIILSNNNNQNSARQFVPAEIGEKQIPAEI